MAVLDTCFVIDLLRELKRGVVGMDALIGCVALERDQIIVTHNLKHFLRIPGLVVEDY